MLFALTRPVVDWNGVYLTPTSVVDVTDWPQDYLDHLLDEGVLVVEPDPVPTDVGSPEITAVVDAAGYAERPQTEASS